MDGTASFDPSSPVHTLFVFTSADGVEWEAASAHLGLPEAWGPSEAGENPASGVELVVCVVESQAEFVGECLGFDIPIELWSWEVEVTVREAATGEAVQTSSFVIPRAAECGQMVAFPPGVERYALRPSLHDHLEAILSPLVAPVAGNPVASTDDYFIGELESACRAIPLPNAAPFAPGAPNPAVAFWGVDPAYEELPWELPDAWQASDPATITLVACADRVESSEARMCTGYVTPWPGEYAIRLSDARYAISVREARTATVLATAEVGVDAGGCPSPAAFDEGILIHDVFASPFDAIIGLLESLG